MYMMRWLFTHCFVFHSTIYVPCAVLSCGVVELILAIGMFVFWFNKHVLVDGCTISNNFAEATAGAIMALRVDVTIVNSTIEGNVATQDYGGIYLNDAHDVKIRNTNIINNTASGNVEILFSDIHSEGSGGLGLSLCSNVVIENCLLDSNSAYQYGGALYITYSENVVVRNTTIRSNIARLGGAVNVYRGNDIQFLSLQFEDNEAKRDGGALHVDETTDVVVSNCTFLRNTARRGSGSAAWLTFSSAAFEGNTFDANEAPLG
jgi:parallel beta-helix repeat protein